MTTGPVIEFNGYRIEEIEYKTINDIKKEKIELYLAQNGSAMLFPYVRSIISVLTTLDGPSAVVLPTVNILEELKKK